MHISGFFLQLIFGTLTTLKIAGCAALLGTGIGLGSVLLESIPIKWLRYGVKSLIFIVRALPELLVLFFIYFGLTGLFNYLFQSYVEINAFAAGVTALSLIFGSYATQVFRSAFSAIDPGQIQAANALGFSRMQIFILIQIRQAWRHAIPGLGNLWLVLLKDTAIVMLIGLPDLMGQAKIAASSTQQPFLFYLSAAGIYLLITSISQQAIGFFANRANRCVA